MRILLLQSASKCEIKSGSSYSFHGCTGKISWPRYGGYGLGRAGAFNAFLRMGWCPEEISEESLPKAGSGDLLIVCEYGELGGTTVTAIKAWMNAGGKVVASGTSLSWTQFLHQLHLELRTESNPYSAIAAVREGETPEIVAPPRWPYFSVDNASESGPAECFGLLAEVHGERQSPSRALISARRCSPYAIRNGNFWLLNADPFAAFQAWLQGQEDLQPWLSWRHRIFWLDEFVAYIKSSLERIGALPVGSSGSGAPGLGATTVVLRHDLDDSRDKTYLGLESERGVAGVHAILKDRNTAFWIDTLGSNGVHESAFHYNTAHYSRAENWLRSRLFGLPTKPYFPAKREIAGDGLLKQVRWAKRNGIGIATLHRHLSFIYYPEYVDALDTVFRLEPEVLGGSSYYRGQLLRWGIDRPDGARGTSADFPDPFFPYWFPFKLAHGGDSGRLLRGWESTSMMEVEPELFVQMLDYSIPGIPQRVITLNYHPAHANGTTFATGGCKTWFREVLEVIDAKRIAVMTLSDVLIEMNKWTAGSTPRTVLRGIPDVR